MRKTIARIMIIVIMLTLGSCKKASSEEYTKYSESFFDTFDTLIQIVGYTKSEEEFNAYVNQMHTRFLELHKLYNIYHDYEGVSNIKTINDQAGIKPVEVDQEIIDLILFAKDWYNKTDGQTNIAMGAVLAIWHDYRERGMDEPENAKLPPIESLTNAEEFTDINGVIVDVDNRTVYLKDSHMRLDVGAIAKGFAVEIIAKEIMAEGFTSGIISAGGNARVLGKPLDGVRSRWGIGIQNPDKFLAVGEGDTLLDTIFLNDAAVVSSGDYQRYYVVNGEAIHHLIDPETLMPGDYFRQVTVLTQDSGLADFMSTTLFLLPLKEGKSLIEKIEGVDAIWVMKDGTIETTDHMKSIMKSNGASGSK